MNMEFGYGNNYGPAKGPQHISSKTESDSKPQYLLLSEGKHQRWEVRIRTPPMGWTSRQKTQL